MTAKRKAKITRLAKVMKAQGRKYSWLVSQTGYSISTIGAAARGEREGSQAFYKSVSMVLGEDVWP